MNNHCTMADGWIGWSSLCCMTTSKEEPSKVEHNLKRLVCPDMFLIHTEVCQSTSRAKHLLDAPLLSFSPFWELTRWILQHGSFAFFLYSLRPKKKKQTLKNDYGNVSLVKWTSNGFFFLKDEKNICNLARHYNIIIMFTVMIFFCPSYYKCGILAFWS